ncbi:N-acetylmuramic acid 6-phosphate etherase [Vagococcus sp. WN89Y]|uniref:N-acetylmuramic acid 6-phosphate etherase n=1 Tax=Vagococcus sp. WN89Y TaxID=3457258 RepID=UPI003FCC978A
MHSQPNGSPIARQNASTVDIDRLATDDMLALINQQDKYVADAITACLPDITRLVDNACAIVHHGGRVVLAGAGASGDAALQNARDFAAADNPLVGLSAGSGTTDFASGASALQAVKFSREDMVVVLTVSGNTPWSLGVLHYAREAGARCAVITRVANSEAAALADILVAPDSGAEVVSGFNEPKARLAQQHVLTMLSTGLAVRSGRVYSNLRVDIPASSLYWAERQIAIVMAATACTREQAKRALASCHQHCRAAIVVLLTGVNARQAAELLAENKDHVRLAMQEVKALKTAS